MEDFNLSLVYFVVTAEVITFIETSSFDENQTPIGSFCGHVFVASLTNWEILEQRLQRAITHYLEELDQLASEDLGISTSSVKFYSIGTVDAEKYILLIPVLIIFLK